jgi:hypothetical protein
MPAERIAAQGSMLNAIFAQNEGAENAIAGASDCHFSTETLLNF